MLSEGQPVLALSVAIRGEVRVHRNCRDLGVLEPGYVIGTALALTGKASRFDATFTEAGRYITWPVSDIRRFMEATPEVQSALQRLVNQDVARKVERLSSA
jgi:CRP-like cAMP-binding protein